MSAAQQQALLLQQQQQAALLQQQALRQALLQQQGQAAGAQGGEQNAAALAQLLQQRALQQQQALMQQRLQQQQQQQQQQGGQGQTAGAQGAQAAEAPGVASEHVVASTCAHPTVSGIIAGNFSVVGSNHDRPVYRKEQKVGELDVLIYFWDERDGVSFSGWWFGPKVGGDQVWAYHGNRAASTPPTTGWKVPYDGTVDPSFSLQPRGSGQEAAGQQQQQHQQQQQQQQYQQQQQQQQQQHQQYQQQQMEHMRRVQEETRQQQEMEQRKQHEAYRAHSEVQNAVQKLRSGTLETLESLIEEVQATWQREGPNCGAEQHRMHEEVQRALEGARVWGQHEQERRKQDEERRAEDEKHYREALERLDKSLQALQALSDAAEASVAKLKEEADLFGEVAEKASEAADIKSAAKPLEEASIAVKIKTKLCTDYVSSNQSSLEEPWPPQGVPPSAEKRPTIQELNAKISNMSLEAEASHSKAMQTKAKLLKSCIAKRKVAHEEALFTKYDEDQDSVLSRSEILKYALGEYKVSVADDAMDRMFLRLVAEGTIGVKKADFHKLKVAIGVYREKLKNDVLKTARLEQERKLEEKREALRKKMGELADNVSTLDTDTIAKVEAKSSNTVDLKGKTSSEISAFASQIEEMAKEAKQTVANKKAELKSLAGDLHESQKTVFDDEARPLEARISQLEARVNKLFTSVYGLREQSRRQAIEELHAIEVRTLAILKHHQTINKLTIDGLFKAMAKADGEKLKEIEFTAFMTACAQAKSPENGVPPTADELSRIFKSLDDEEVSFLTKDQLAPLLRVFMRVCEEADMTEALSTSSSSVIRPVSVDEIVEVMEGPTKGDSGVERVHAKAVKDGKEGWITTKGAGDKSFLEETEVLFRVVKETIMTSCFELGKEKPGKRDATRKVKLGEVVAVRKWPIKEEKSGLTRMLCKAKNDGMAGWVTTLGNGGTVFFEQVPPKQVEP